MRTACAAVAVTAGLALAVAEFPMPPAHADSGPIEDRSWTPLPVLMIHGSGMNSGTWNALIGHLRAEGWPAEFLMAVDLAPDDGANIAAAESQLLPAARRLLQRASGWAARQGRPPPAKLAVIGHSMGAVSGRWLVTRQMPEQVALFVSIGGANHGSNALCGMPGSGNRELCPAFPQGGHSAVLDALNGTSMEPADETPYGPGPDPDGVRSILPTPAACVAWQVIWIDPDEWIMPSASARLGGSGGLGGLEVPEPFHQLAAGDYLLRAPVRHDDLPSAPAVIELVTAALRSRPHGCSR